jgi:hypothetical protein
MLLIDRGGGLLHTQLGPAESVRRPTSRRRSAPPPPQPTRRRGCQGAARAPPPRAPLRARLARRPHRVSRARGGTGGLSPTSRPTHRVARRVCLGSQGSQGRLSVRSERKRESGAAEQVHAEGSATCSLSRWICNAGGPNLPSMQAQPPCNTGGPKGGWACTCCSCVALLVCCVARVLPSLPATRAGGSRAPPTAPVRQRPPLLPRQRRRRRR